MAVISNVVTKIYSFVQIVGLSDPVPQFFENNLTQLEGMSHGVTVDTLELSWKKSTWGTKWCWYSDIPGRE